ncbi:hypothetical protein H6A68_08820, partial [Bifidobacterium pullorum subsp. saeculare]|uniref:hypothetical protein n=1 Tax=Bifidobacterium pullorum TaxID=78448 RepID=UPI001958C8A0
PAGQVLQVGIRAGGNRVTAFTTPALGDGARLFVFAIGLLAKTPREQAGFQLMTLDGQGVVRFVRQNPTIYAFHAAPDVRAIDI